MKIYFKKYSLYEIFNKSPHPHLFEYDVRKQFSKVNAKIYSFINLLFLGVLIG